MEFFGTRYLWRKQAFDLRHVPIIIVVFEVPLLTLHSNYTEYYNALVLWNFFVRNFVDISFGIFLKAYFLDRELYFCGNMDFAELPPGFS